MKQYKILKLIGALSLICSQAYLFITTTLHAAPIEKPILTSNIYGYAPTMDSIGTLMYRVGPEGNRGAFDLNGRRVPTVGSIIGFKDLSCKEDAFKSEIMAEKWQPFFDFKDKDNDKCNTAQLHTVEWFMIDNGENDISNVSNWSEIADNAVSINDNYPDAIIAPKSQASFEIDNSGRFESVTLPIAGEFTSSIRVPEAAIGKYIAVRYTPIAATGLPKEGRPVEMWDLNYFYSQSPSTKPGLAGVIDTNFGQTKKEELNDYELGSGGGRVQAAPEAPQIKDFTVTGIFAPGNVLDLKYEFIPFPKTNPTLKDESIDQTVFIWGNLGTTRLFKEAYNETQSVEENSILLGQSGRITQGKTVELTLADIGNFVEVTALAMRKTQSEIYPVIGNSLTYRISDFEGITPLQRPVVADLTLQGTLAIGQKLSATYTYVPSNSLKNYDNSKYTWSYSTVDFNGDVNKPLETVILNSGQIETDPQNIPDYSQSPVNVPSSDVITREILGTDVITDNMIGNILSIRIDAIDAMGLTGNFVETTSRTRAGVRNNMFGIKLVEYDYGGSFPMIPNYGEGFPSTGFAGATFRLFAEDFNLTNNTNNWDWSIVENPYYAKVDKTGMVTLLRIPPKDGVIRVVAVNKTDPTNVRSHSFTIDKWLISFNELSGGPKYFTQSGAQNLCANFRRDDVKQVFLPSVEDYTSVPVDPNNKNQSKGAFIRAAGWSTIYTFPSDDFFSQWGELDVYKTVNRSIWAFPEAGTPYTWTRSQQESTGKFIFAAPTGWADWFVWNDANRPLNAACIVYADDFIPEIPKITESNFQGIKLPYTGYPKNNVGFPVQHAEGKGYPSLGFNGATFILFAEDGPGSIFMNSNVTINNINWTWKINGGEEATLLKPSQNEYAFVTYDGQVTLLAPPPKNFAIEITARNGSQLRRHSFTIDQWLYNYQELGQTSIQQTFAAAAQICSSRGYRIPLVEEWTAMKADPNNPEQSVNAYQREAGGWSIIYTFPSSDFYSQWGELDIFYSYNPVSRALSKGLWPNSNYWSSSITKSGKQIVARNAGWGDWSAYTGNISTGTNFFGCISGTQTFLPKVENVSINGEVKVGSQLEGSYQFIEGKSNNPADNSFYKWDGQNSNNTTETTITTTGNAGSYNVVEADVGKVISLTITPRDVSGQIGLPEKATVSLNMPPSVNNLAIDGRFTLNATFNGSYAFAGGEVGTTVIDKSKYRWSVWMNEPGEADGVGAWQVIEDWTETTDGKIAPLTLADATAEYLTVKLEVQPIDQFGQIGQTESVQLKAPQITDLSIASGIFAPGQKLRGQYTYRAGISTNTENASLYAFTFDKNTIADLAEADYRLIESPGLNGQLAYIDSDTITDSDIGKIAILSIKPIDKTNLQGQTKSTILTTDVLSNVTIKPIANTAEANGIFYLVNGTEVEAFYDILANAGNEQSTRQFEIDPLRTTYEWRVKGSEAIIGTSKKITIPAGLSGQSLTVTIQPVFKSGDFGRLSSAESEVIQGYPAVTIGLLKNQLNETNPSYLFGGDRISLVSYEFTSGILDETDLTQYRYLLANVDEVANPAAETDFITVTAWQSAANGIGDFVLPDNLPDARYLVRIEFRPENGLNIQAPIVSTSFIANRSESLLGNLSITGQFTDNAIFNGNYTIGDKEPDENARTQYRWSVDGTFQANWATVDRGSIPPLMLDDATTEGLVIKLELKPSAQSPDSSIVFVELQAPQISLLQIDKGVFAIGQSPAFTYSYQAGISPNILNASKYSYSIDGSKLVDNEFAPTSEDNQNVIVTLPILSANEIGKLVVVTMTPIDGSGLQGKSKSTQLSNDAITSISITVRSGGLNDNYIAEGAVLEGMFEIDPEYYGGLRDAVIDEAKTTYEWRVQGSNELLGTEKLFTVPAGMIDERFILTIKPVYMNGDAGKPRTALSLPVGAIASADNLLITGQFESQAVFEGAYTFISGNSSAIDNSQFRWLVDGIAQADWAKVPQSGIVTPLELADATAKGLTVRLEIKPINITNAPGEVQFLEYRAPQVDNLVLSGEIDLDNPDQSLIKVSYQYISGISSDSRDNSNVQALVDGQPVSWSINTLGMYTEGRLNKQINEAVITIEPIDQSGLRGQKASISIRTPKIINPVVTGVWAEGNSMEVSYEFDSGLANDTEDLSTAQIHFSNGRIINVNRTNSQESLTFTVEPWMLGLDYALTVSPLNGINLKGSDVTVNFFQPFIYSATDSGFQQIRLLNGEQQYVVTTGYPSSLSAKVGDVISFTVEVDKNQPQGEILPIDKASQFIANWNKGTNRVETNQASYANSDIVRADSRNIKRNLLITYTIKPEDLGQKTTFEVTFVAPNGDRSNTLSHEFMVQEDSTDDNRLLPSVKNLQITAKRISGTDNAELSGVYEFIPRDSTTGTNGNTDASTYVWLKNGVPVTTAQPIKKSGVVEPLTVVKNDINALFTLSINAKDSAGYKSSTAMTQDFRFVAPQISGLAFDRTITTITPDAVIGATYQFQPGTPGSSDKSTYVWTGASTQSSPPVPSIAPGAGINTVPSYTVKSADVGKLIKLTVTATDNLGKIGNSESIQSPAVKPLQGPMVTNIEIRPEVTNLTTAKLNGYYQFSRGVNPNTNDASVYVWLKDGIEVTTPKAITASGVVDSYTVNPKDINATFTLSIRAKDVYGMQAASSTTQTFKFALPSISNLTFGTTADSLDVGKTISATYNFTLGTANTADASSYQWQGAAIDAIQKVTTPGKVGGYTIKNSDAGSIIRLEVTPIDSLGINGIPKSIATNKQVTVVAPQINELTITSQNGLLEGASLKGTYKFVPGLSPNTADASVYQWVGKNTQFTNETKIRISGQIDEYVIAKADAGNVITLKVTPKDVASATTGVVGTVKTAQITAAYVLPQVRNISIFYFSGIKVGDKLGGGFFFVPGSNSVNRSEYRWVSKSKTTAWKYTEFINSNGALAVDAYDIVEGDVGSVITLEAKPIDGNNKEGPIGSASTGIVVSANVPLVPPQVDSITINAPSPVRVGNKLSATYRFVKGSDATDKSTYNWAGKAKDATKPIVTSGKVDDYTIVDADIGSVISLTVNPIDGVNQKGQSKTAQTTSSVLTNKPTVSDVKIYYFAGVKVGDKLGGSYRFTPGSINSDKSTYTWKGNAISAELPNTGNGSVGPYTISEADAGKVIELAVTAKDGTSTGNTAKDTTATVEKPLFYNVNFTVYKMDLVDLHGNWRFVTGDMSWDQNGKACNINDWQYRWYIDGVVMTAPRDAWKSASPSNFTCTPRGVNFVEIIPTTFKTVYSTYEYYQYELKYLPTGQTFKSQNSINVP